MHSYIFALSSPRDFFLLSISLLQRNPSAGTPSSRQHDPTARSDLIGSAGASACSMPSARRVSESCAMRSSQRQAHSLQIVNSDILDKLSCDSTEHRQREQLHGERLFCAEEAHSASFETVRSTLACPLLRSATRSAADLFPRSSGRSAPSFPMSRQARTHHSASPVTPPEQAHAQAGARAEKPGEGSTRATPAQEHQLVSPPYDVGRLFEQAKDFPSKLTCFGSQIQPVGLPSLHLQRGHPALHLR